MKIRVNDLNLINPYLKKISDRNELFTGRGMKMNRIIAVFSVFLMFTASLSAQSKVDLVRDKGNAKRDEIIKKDEEHRQRILKKFYDFQAKVLKMAPGMNIDIPVDPGETDDIKDQKTASEYEKGNEFDA